MILVVVKRLLIFLEHTDTNALHRSNRFAILVNAVERFSLFNSSQVIWHGRDTQSGSHSQYATIEQRIQILTRKNVSQMRGGHFIYECANRVVQCALFLVATSAYERTARVSIVLRRTRVVPRRKSSYPKPAWRQVMDDATVSPLVLLSDFQQYSSFPQRTQIQDVSKSVLLS